MKLLSNRNKLLRLADRESWTAAIEFQEDDLTSNSEDEKKIKKAVKFAKEKNKKNS